MISRIQLSITNFVPKYILIAMYGFHKHLWADLLRWFSSREVFLVEWIHYPKVGFLCVGAKASEIQLLLLPALLPT